MSATWLKDPKGIRNVEEWYMSTAIRFDYVYKVFEKRCEIGIKNIEKLAPVLVSEAGLSLSAYPTSVLNAEPFISPQAYRDLYKPFQKAINDKIHELTSWKRLLIHAAVYPTYRGYDRSGI